MNPDPDRLRADVLTFYDRRKRDLPWRGEEDPYRILVSEIMLQQTRVDTVRGYYESWLQRFPDVDALAAADEDVVLKAWEGLGYYRRARNLHAAARVVRERSGGELPASAAELRALPGIGEYTAGAVASIAFGEAVPAVDGNVRRVLSRWHDVAEPSPRWLRDRAAELVDRDRPGDWNQALMELGATVCTPREPRCGECPVAWACGAHEAGTVHERPAPTKKQAPREAIFALCVLRTTGGAVLLQRRPAGGLLGGMWTLPEREVDAAADAEQAACSLGHELLGGMREPSDGALPGGVSLTGPTPLPEVRHRFSHIDATYVPWRIDVEPGENPLSAPGDPPFHWASPAEVDALALPVAQRSVLEHL